MELNNLSDRELYETYKDIHNDKEKMEVIAQIVSLRYKSRLLETVKSDYIKKHYLEEIPIETYRTRIIKTIKNDKLKNKLAETCKLQSNKIEILKTIKDEEYKLRIIDELEKKEDKLQIIETLSEYKIKMKEIKKIDEKYKELIKSNENKDDVTRKILNEIKPKYTEIGVNPKIRFGIEIEITGDASCVINALDTINGDWQTEEEVSIDNGVEVKSPILHDNKQSIEAIYTTFQLLKNLNMKPDSKCGGHIHVDSSYLTTIESYKSLFDIVGNCEKILYIISNQAGQTPRKGILQYADTIIPELQTLEYSIEPGQTKDEFIEKAKKVQAKKYKSMNLLNINNNKNTIEFRFPNEPKDPDTCIENIKLVLNVIEKSEEIGKELKNKNINSTGFQFLKKLKRTESESGRVEILMDLLFNEDEESKKVYKERYWTNKEKEEQSKDNPTKNMQYHRIGLTDIYESGGRD